MIRSALVVGLTVASPLWAQEPTRPTLLAGQLLSVVRGDNLPELLEQLRTTPLGRLCTEGSGRHVLERITAHGRKRADRRTELLGVAADLGIMLPQHVIQNLYGTPDMSRLVANALTEFDSCELQSGFAPTEQQDVFPRPRFAMVLRCRPPFEGRWTQAFEQEAALMRKAPWFEERQGAKVARHPAYAFRQMLPEEPDPDMAAIYEVERVETWMLHLPQTFLFANGTPPDREAVEGLTQGGSEPELSMSFFPQTFVELFEAAGGPPAESVLLGYDELKEFTWRGGVVDGRIQDELILDMESPRTGLVGALVGGKAEPPAQPLPDGAIFQVRAAADVEQVMELVTGVAGDGVPEEVPDLLQEALDGGFALGVCAPAPGGVVPRVFLSLGIADPEPWEEFVAKLAATGVRSKDATYEDVPCKVLELPDAPQGIQPAWCRIDGRIHVAESARSLRAFLKARNANADAVAMDVGDVLPPSGPGARVETFDMRLDEVELYRAYRDIWLPLYEMAVTAPTAVRGNDLPEVDEFAEFAGRSRGALFRDGNRLHLRHEGALGSPWLAALMLTWGPILSGLEGADYTTDEVAAAIGAHRLEQVWPAFEAFQQREGRWPRDLGELFTAHELADDALLIPGDEGAETIELAGGRTIRTSFRYYPEPAVFDSWSAGQNGVRVLLVELVERGWERKALSVDGELHSGDGAMPDGGGR